MTTSDRRGPKNRIGETQQLEIGVAALDNCDDCVVRVMQRLSNAR